MAPGTPEQMMEERIARLVAETIDIAALAIDPEQRPLTGQQARGIAQILLRCKLILSLLEGDEVSEIKRLILALEDAKRPPPAFIGRTVIPLRAPAS